MSSLNTILAQFAPIGLAEMDSVKLMDRTDTKFSFPLERLAFILSQLTGHYKVLTIEGVKVCTYKTLYYDTETLNLYMAHHNERANRYKIRHRSYVDSNIGFMEVKFKNNKGRTIKERIRQNLTPDLLSDEAKEFVSKQSGIDAAKLKPVVWVNYQRITLVGESERVTIDINLEFARGNDHHDLKNIAIAEVKQSKHAASPVFAILKAEKLRQSSISKYCLGIISTHPGIKQNNFKQKIRSMLKQCA